MLVGSTLQSREDGLIDTMLEVAVVFAEEDKTSTGTTEGLVGSGGDDIGILERISGLCVKVERCSKEERVRLVFLLTLTIKPAYLLSSDKTRDVSHIHHHEGTVGISNRTDTGIVPEII